MATEPQEITTLVGREVYSNNGIYIGQVEDIKLDFGAERIAGLALNQINTELLGSTVEDNRGVMIPYRWIQGIGDVIIISDVVERVSVETADEEEEEATA